MWVDRVGRVAIATMLVVMLLGGSASGLGVIIPSITWASVIVEASDAVWEDTPVIDGKLIAWEDDDGVKVKNLATGEVRRMPDTGAGVQHEPDVSGDRVVYQDDTSGNWDIKQYYWSTGNVTNVVATADNETNPRIDGNYVIWYNDGAAVADDNLWMRSYDMAGGTVKLTQGHPDIAYDVDNGRVALLDRSSRTLFIRTLRPDSGWPTVANYTFGQQALSIEMHGDRVVVDLYDGVSDYDAVSYNIATDAVTDVAVESDVNETGPSIFHNSVAWADDGATTDSDIGYRWIEGLFFFQTPSFGDSVQDDWNPSLYGRRTAYERAGAGDSDVMLATSDTKLQSRTAGVNRYATAAATSASYFSDATHVVLCNGLNFPDALSAAPLAKALNGPLLLTAPGSLSPEALTEITRLGPTKVWIIGGSDVVSNAIYNQLDLTYDVERIAGDDRYATSAAIARKLESIAGPSVVFRAFFARGDAFPDALAVGPVAAAAVGPVMLVRPTAVPPSIASAVNDLDITIGYIIGGEDVVSPGVNTTLRGLITANGAVGTITERWEGPNRYATAAAVANKGLGNRWIDLDTVGFAIGTNFPDALGGGAALGHYGSALLLTSGTALSGDTGSFLDAHRYEVGRADFFGGSDVLKPAVSTAVMAKIY